MKRPTLWVPVLQWVGASTAFTCILWIPAAAVASALGSPLGFAALPGTVVLYVLYSPEVVPVIIVASAPFYSAILWVWAVASRRRPWIDLRWQCVLGFAGAVSVIPAAASALLAARGGAVGPDRDFFAWFCCSWVTFWGAITSPRWLLDSLSLGTFSGEARVGWGHDV